MINHFITTLSSFTPITLEEMSGIKLMNRIDTKYITTEEHLVLLLNMLKKKYRIQVVGGERLIDYRTTYLDTPSLEMFIAHQTGRKVREKIRVRSYIASHLTFLEVKNKDNHGRCDKKRINVNNISTLKEDGAEDFLRSSSWYSLSELTPQLMNTFSRITLVDNEKTERLTIDTNIKFTNLTNNNKKTLGKMVIIELKRNGRKMSYAARLLHEQFIRKASISKYCVGMAMTNNKIRQNRFKELLMLVNDINRPTSYTSNKNNISSVCTEQIHGIQNKYKGVVPINYYMPTIDQVQLIY
jgi:hypothetical protein